MRTRLLQRKFTAIIVFFVTLNSFAQDSWTPSEMNGFGNNYNETVKHMIPFKGALYAGVGDSYGEIWSSTTGNIGSWTNVYFNANVSKISALATTTEGAGYIYMSGYASGSDVPTVYSSIDGTTWSPYFKANYEVTFIVPFKGTGTVDSIYTFEDNYWGTKVYRSIFDSNDPSDTLGTTWDTLFDFSSFSAYTRVTSTFVNGGKLYAGTSGATLWSTVNGTNWVMNDSVGNGFGNPNNNEISAITSFGGYLYVGTYNNSDGAQLWRSSDELTWTMVNQYSAYDHITDLEVIGGNLWTCLKSANNMGALVERSVDGVTFITSTNNGFGAMGSNHGEYGNLTAFGNNIYYGSRNYGMPPIAHPGGHGGFFSTGGQIWRSCLGVPPVISVGPDQIICSSTSATFNADAGFSNYYWNDGSTLQSITTNVSGNHYVIATDINGCDAMDTASLGLLTSPTITVTTPNLMAYTLCSGSSLTTVDTAISNLRINLPPTSKSVNDTVFDYSTINDTINISGISGFEGAATSIVSVTIDSLYHTNNSDLLIRLYAPDSSYSDLSYYNGFGYQNFIGTVFSQNATGYLASGIGPYMGNFLPDGNFGNFSGPANGNWRLSISDNYPGNIGVLKGWSITLSVADTLITYSWSPATGVASATSLNTVITPTTSTQYTLTATNSIGCPSSITDTLTVPQIDIPLTHDTICYGNSAIITASGGNAYYWSPSTALNTTSGDTVIASPTAPINYYVSDTVSGCPVADSIHIYVNAQIFLTPPTSQMVCYADSLTLSATASGGTPAYIFSWFDGSTTHTGSSLSLPYTTSTSYTVTVQDAYDCAISGTTDVTVIPSTNIYGHVNYTGGNVALSPVVLYQYVPFNTHFDTVQVVSTDASGNYMFPSVNHGDYLIKVFPAATYTTLVPTYYGDQFIWVPGLAVNHDCSANDTLDVSMVEETVVAGPGGLGGRIVEGVGFVRAPGDPVPGIDVKLGRNPGGQLVTNGTTDNNGYYTFTGVAYNNPGEHYTVYVDIPGLARDSSYSVVLDAAHAVYDSLNYLVDSSSIYIVPTSGTGVDAISGDNFNFSIFPNPAKENATIEYTIASEAKVSLAVYNVLGMKMTGLADAKQSTGTYKYNLNVKNNNLKTGVYFVTLIVDGKTSIHKIVITE